ncbi:MAG: PIN domain-containing protein [Candidatus Nanopelagicales bacterium]|nr:PIN domain-containing protein [Candidatus Nanopelagicales bacterium]MCF8538536.1 PIN domain-containing protein [Candidatus Nanopelagicales bacterium]MCF8543538.1 PIN domain-containing protein [Candidatus Nanopelagicales bacterium]MCF8558407.1 PIN domain-containing protein [Candidatus Nanopelagicales bacterium]
MRVVDTSIIVRAATTPHPQERERLQDVIAESPVPIAHVLAESYATLSRLPPPFRLSPRDCLTFLSSAFRSDTLTLSPGGYVRVMQILAERGVSGGAIYDCVIAETAREHHATLMSLDRRAADRYSMVGADHQIL